MMLMLSYMNSFVGFSFREAFLTILHFMNFFHSMLYINGFWRVSCKIFVLGLDFSTDCISVYFSLIMSSIDV